MPGTLPPDDAEIMGWMLDEIRKLRIQSDNVEKYELQQFLNAGWLSIGLADALYIFDGFAILQGTIEWVGAGSYSPSAIIGSGAANMIPGEFGPRGNIGFRTLAHGQASSAGGFYDQPMHTLLGKYSAFGATGVYLTLGYLDHDTRWQLADGVDMVNQIPLAPHELSIQFTWAIDPTDDIDFETIPV